MWTSVSNMFLNDYSIIFSILYILEICITSLKIFSQFVSLNKKTLRDIKFNYNNLIYDVLNSYISIQISKKQRTGHNVVAIKLYFYLK
jgi:hypothetical protein